MRVALWLILGALSGAGFSAAAFTLRWGAKRILGYALMVAAVVYLPAAILHGHSTPVRMVAAPIGVVLYWTIAFVGMQGSSWWLVAGWITRPVWNLALHHLGPDAAVIPSWFPIFWAGFDVTIAAAIVAFEDLSQTLI
jgi:hypothetical protein